MSSHHIIREKQEPALLVLGLDNFEDDLLGQLLEWSPTLIVTTDTAEQLNAFGIKFDVLISNGVGTDNLQSDIKHITSNGDKPAQAALKYLTANNYPAVNIIANQLDLDDYLPYAAIINIVLFNNKRKIYPVTSGFTKWKPAGDVIELLDPINSLAYNGLENIGDKRYKTTNDGFFTLRFSQPFIFIAEGI